MADHRSPIVDTLTRTLLRLLAGAGLLAMLLPSLPGQRPEGGAAHAARTVAGTAYAPGR